MKLRYKLLCLFALMAGPILACGADAEPTSVPVVSTATVEPTIEEDPVEEAEAIVEVDAVAEEVTEPEPTQRRNPTLEPAEMRATVQAALTPEEARATLAALGTPTDLQRKFAEAQLKITPEPTSTAKAKQNHIYASMTPEEAIGHCIGLIDNHYYGIPTLEKHADFEGYTAFLLGALDSLSDDAYAYNFFVEIFGFADRVDEFNMILSSKDDVLYIAFCNGSEIPPLMSLEEAIAARLIDP
jgi:hypothetical protein